jgi:DNA-binding transcriptional ArsR family regulator
MNVSMLCASAAVVADPTRVRVLVALHEGGLCVSELALRLGVVPSVVCHHLFRLEQAGLVTRTQRGRRTVARRVEARWRQVVEAFGTS